MQLTYEESFQVRTTDEWSPDDTRNIPFFGFVTGTLISLGMWSMLAWIVWALVD